MRAKRPVVESDSESEGDTNLPCINAGKRRRTHVAQDDDDDTRWEPPPSQSQHGRLFEDDELLDAGSSSNASTEHKNAVPTKQSVFMATAHRSANEDENIEAVGAFRRGELPAHNAERPAAVVYSRYEHEAAFNRAFANLKVKTKRDPPSRLALAKSLDELLQLPPKRSVDCGYTRTHKMNGQESWVFYLQNNNLPKWGTIGQCWSIQKSFYTQKEIEQQKPFIKQIVDRYPQDVPSLTAATKNLIRKAAALLADADAKQYYHKIYHATSDTGHYYGTRIRLVNPSSGDSSDIVTCMLPVSQVLDTDVPYAPANCIFEKKDIDEDIEDGDADAYIAATIPDDISAAERPRHVAAIKIMQMMAYEFHGKMITKADFLRARVIFLAQYTNYKHQLTGPYNGSTLLRITVNRALNPPRTSIKPSPAVQTDLEGDWPTLWLRTFNTARTAIVVDVIYQVWMNTGDFLEAWRAGCKAADAVNAMILAGEASPPLCSCSAAMSHTVYHPCGKCRIVTLCKRLHNVASGLPVCTSCKQDLDISGHQATDHETGGQFLKNRLLTYLRKEWKLANPKKNRKEITALLDPVLEAGWQEITSLFSVGKDGEEWRDSYTNAVTLFETIAKEHHFGEEGKRHPLSPSIDAIWPYIMHGERAGIHVPGNLALTAECLNYAKHYFAPAILEVLARWLNSKQTGNDRQAVMKALTDLWQVALMSALSRVTRLQLDISPEDLEEQMQSWLAGRPLGARPSKESSAWIGRMLHIESGSPGAPPDVDRINKVVAEIEEKFQDTFAGFPRSDDGCAYPFAPEWMPTNWNWTTAWEFFAVRAHRMWLLCNGRWIQVDVVETIYLECLWQAADPEYKTHTQLPLSVEPRHPSRVVAAHDKHGQQLRTGWTRQKPESIADRDDSLCNMVPQAHIENMLVLNYSDEHVPRAIEKLKSVKLSKELFNPNIANDVKKMKEVDIDFEELGDDGASGADADIDEE